MSKDGLVFEVTVAEARSLMAADKNGKSDPYAVVELVADAGGKALKGESFKTKTHKKTLDPKFGERFTLGAATEDAELAAASLRVRLWDYDSMLSSDALGEIVMPLSRLIPGGDLADGFDGWLALSAMDKATAAAASLGELKLTVRARAAPSAARAEGPEGGVEAQQPQLDEAACAAAAEAVDEWRSARKAPLIDWPLDPEARVEGGFGFPLSAARAAAADGDVEMLGKLARLGADLEGAAHLAVRNGHRACVRAIALRDTAMLQVPDARGSTPSHEAAKADDADALALLAKLRANVNATNHAGKTPAHCALERGHRRALGALAALGVDIAAVERTSLDCGELGCLSRFPRVPGAMLGSAYD